MSDTSRQQGSQGAEFRTAEQQQQAAGQPLEKSVQTLAKYGGFNFLENSIDGIKNLNPERKALRRIFLTDPEKKKEREALKKRLELWLNLMKESTEINQMVEKGTERGTKAGELLNTNL